MMRNLITRELLFVKQYCFNRKKTEQKTQIPNSHVEFTEK